MKQIIVLTLLLLLIFVSSTIAAEETERERLVRIETKLDVLIQNDQKRVAQYEKMETRVGLIEQAINKHSTWWTMAWSVLGVFGTAIAGLVVKAFWGAVCKTQVEQGVKT